MASRAAETPAENPKPPAAAAAAPMVGPYSQALAEGTNNNKKGDNTTKNVSFASTDGAANAAAETHQDPAAAMPPPNANKNPQVAGKPVLLAPTGMRQPFSLQFAMPPHMQGTYHHHGPPPPGAPPPHYVNGTRQPPHYPPMMTSRSHSSSIKQLQKELIYVFGLVTKHPRYRQQWMAAEDYVRILVWELDLWRTVPLNAGMLTVALATFGGAAEDINKSGLFCREIKHWENNNNGTTARTSTTTSYYYVTDPGSKPLPPTSNWKAAIVTPVLGKERFAAKEPNYAVRREAFVRVLQQFQPQLPPAPFAPYPPPGYPAAASNNPAGPPPMLVQHPPGGETGSPKTGAAAQTATQSLSEKKGSAAKQLSPPPVPPLGPPTPFVPPLPYGAYPPPMPYGTVPGPNLQPVQPRPPPPEKKKKKADMLAQAQKKVAEARAARSIAAAKKEIAKEAPSAPAPVPEQTPRKSKKKKLPKKRKKPAPPPRPPLPSTELTVASAEALDTSRRASADDVAAKRARTTTTTTTIEQSTTGSRATYRTSCNSAQASREAAAQPLFRLQWQQGDPVPPPKRDQEQLGRVIAHAFAKLLKVPALQGRWYTANCLANMLRQRHDFSDACEFDVSFMDQAIKERFWMIGSDGGAYNQSGAFRFTKPIYWPGNREAVQVLFYHFTKPGRFGVDWSETPEDSLQKAREPDSSYKGWYEFFEKFDKMPAFFSLVQRSTPPDEVDEQIDVLREIAVERQQQLEERLNQTNEEMAKEHEARTKEAKAKRAAKKRENWDAHEGRKLFRPRKNEKSLDALRRRMEILDKVINEYDGFRLVLSEEDLTEHDIMISSEHIEERIFISKQIFSVRHRATCLRLAYSFVLERMGEGSSVSFFSCGKEALRRMGLNSTGSNKNRVTEYNVQFRDREKFPLTLSLPKGRKDRLSVPMRVQRRRRNNTNENLSVPAPDDDDDDEEEENTAIAKFMVKNRYV